MTGWVRKKVMCFWNVEGRMSDVFPRSKNAAKASTEKGKAPHISSRRLLLTHVKYSCCLTVFPAQIPPVVFSTSPPTWYESRRDSCSCAATDQHRFGSLDSSHFAL